MILIAGNNIASLFLSAYFEKEKIQYKRLYTKEIKDFTFYFNDYSEGMQKKAMDLIDYRIEFAKSKYFGIRTSKTDYQIGQQMEEFVSILTEHYENEKDNLEIYREMVEGIGSEWKGVVDNNFQMKVAMNSLMTKNFGKGYRKFVYSKINDEELRNVLMSFVPKRDISLNTASGYIMNQIFDTSYRENRIEEFVIYIKKLIKEENQILINSFANMHVDKEQKKIFYDRHEFIYDFLINAQGDGNSNVRLTTFYVESLNKIFQHYTFFCLEDMVQQGINQMVLWKGKNGYQLDVYYESELTDESRIVKYINKKLNYIKILKTVGYTQLKEQYGCGSFAGWAFSCEENMKNPMSCMKNNIIDISNWGNAHFTSALLAISFLEKAGIC